MTLSVPVPLLTPLTSITPILPVISNSPPSVPQSWAGGAPAWSQSSASRLHHSGELPDCTGGGKVLAATINSHCKITVNTCSEVRNICDLRYWPGCCRLKTGCRLSLPSQTMWRRWRSSSTHMRWVEFVVHNSFLVNMWLNRSFFLTF